MALGDITLGAASILNNGTTYQNAFNKPRIVWLSDTKLLYFYTYTSSTQYTFRYKVINKDSNNVFTFPSTEYSLFNDTYSNGIFIEHCEAVSSTLIVLQYRRSSNRYRRVLEVDSNGAYVGISGETILPLGGNDTIKRVAENKLAAVSENYSSQYSTGIIYFYNISAGGFSQQFSHQYKNTNSLHIMDVSIVSLDDNVVSILTSDPASGRTLRKYDISSGSLVQSNSLPQADITFPITIPAGENKILAFTSQKTYGLFDVSDTPTRIGGLYSFGFSNDITIESYQEFSNINNQVGVLLTRNATLAKRFINSIHIDSSNNLTVDTLEIANTSLGTVQKDVQYSIRIADNGHGLFLYSSSYDINSMPIYIEGETIFNQEYTSTGTISTTSNFAYELDLSSSYNFTGLLLVSDSTTYDGYINAEYTSSSSLSLSAVNDYSLGVEIVDYSSILITSSIESEVDRICETSGVITSSANFEYTDQPEFRFTFSGSIQTDSEIIEYYQDIGPVVVYHENAYNFLPTETENSEYNHSYYVTVTPTKKVRIFTPADGSLWAQFIDIDPNTGELALSTPVKRINAGSTWFTGLNTSHSAPQYMAKDAGYGFVVFQTGDNRMTVLQTNITTNQFSSLYSYQISNPIDTAPNVTYTITDFEVINNTQFIAFYETGSSAEGTTHMRLATYTLNEGNTFDVAYTVLIPELSGAVWVKAVKIRDDAFLTHNSGSNFIYERVGDVWVSTPVYFERFSYTHAYNIGENKVLAFSVSDGIYVINTSGNTIVSEVYSSPLEGLPLQHNSTTFLSESSEIEGEVIDLYYFVIKRLHTHHLMPNDTMQEEAQVISRKKFVWGVPVPGSIFPGGIVNSYGDFGLFEYANDEDGIHNITPFDLSGPQSFVYTSNSFISTNVYSDHVFYPNFPALIEGIHLQTSGYVEIQRDFLFNMESSATLESGTVAFVEYIKEVSGTVTASSSTEYEEFNEYFSTIESNIIVSSVIETEQTYDYIPIINGNIFTSSIEEYYPETPRFADGQVLLSNHIDVYSDKFALANSTIQVSSTADYFYAGPLFLPELSGTIQLSGDFVYLINSFEDVASGEINVSSDFDISHKLDYVYSFSRTINISGDSSTQRGYEVNGDGVIYTDLFPEYEPGFEYDETGQIVIDGIATAEVYSKGYIYEGDVEAIVSSYSEFNNEYILTTQGEIHVLMDAVIDVDTYKYGVGGTIFVTSTSLYGWLADSKEVFRVIGLITKDVRCIGLMRKDIRVQGCISKDVPVYSRL